MFEPVVDINDELHHATLQDPTTKEAVAIIQAWENGSKGADFVRLVNLLDAALEMLEALEALLPLAENYYYNAIDGGEYTEQFEAARAAIAKAKGGTP